MDPYDAWRHSADLLRAEAGAYLADEWASCPWAWLRDLPEGIGHDYGASILQLVLGTQGLPCKKLEVGEGQPALVQVGGAQFALYMAVRHFGGSFWFNIRQPPRGTSHLLLLGLSPETVHLWVSTAKAWKDESGWARFAEESPPPFLEGGQLDQGIEAVHQAHRDEVGKQLAERAHKAIEVRKMKTPLDGAKEESDD